MTNPKNNLDGPVAVVGGGVVGCFVAYCLAGMGVPVTLIDQEGPGAGATGNSAGNGQPGSADCDVSQLTLGAESLARVRHPRPQVSRAARTG